MPVLTRGERFKDARTVHNQHGSQTMSMVQHETGVSASLIADLENDEKERKANYIDVAKLAAHYGVTTDWLCSLSEDPYPIPCATNELGLSQKAVEVLKNIQALDDSDEVISGMSMFLEGVNTIPIGKGIKQFSDAVQIEKEYLHKYVKGRSETQNCLLGYKQIKHFDDGELADNMLKELNKSHPEANGRIVVFCGDSALETRKKELLDFIIAQVDIQTGYLDLLTSEMHY